MIDSWLWLGGVGTGVLGRDVSGGGGGGRGLYVGGGGESLRGAQSLFG